MKLLDAIQPLRETRVGASAATRAPAVFISYSRDSFHVERAERMLKTLRERLATRRYCIVVFGFAHSGELESQLIERMDAVAERQLEFVSQRLATEPKDLVLTANYDELVRIEAASLPSDAVRVFEDAYQKGLHGQLSADSITLLFCTELNDWLPALSANDFGTVVAVHGDPAQAPPKTSDDLTNEVTETPLPASMAPELHDRYEKARAAFVREQVLRSSEDLARAVGSKATNRSLTASKWLRDREIFAVKFGGRVGFPAFQFDPVSGRPKPVIARIIKAFPQDADGWRIALWMTSANPRLSNDRPVDVLDKNPEQVIRAAQGENRSEVF